MLAQVASRADRADDDEHDGGERVGAQQPARPSTRAVAGDAGGE